MKIRYSDRLALYRHIECEALEAASAVLDERKTKQRLSFRLGARAAPLFVGFALFIAEQSIIDDVAELFFFTREGEFFLRVFREVVPSGRIANHDLPAATILEVSRLATFSASLRSITIKEMMRLWSLYDSQSIFALGKSLGLDPAILSPACSRYSLALDEPIIRPWQDERIKALFADVDVVRILEEKVAADRFAALAYLARHGLAGERREVGVVDIGWRGTIQDNLALMLPDTRIFGYYMGLQRFLNLQPPNCVKRAFGPDANQDLLFSHLLDAVSPVEMLCNSPLGSVMGYRFEDGEPRAIRLIEPSEGAIHADVVEHFQAGALFACRHWAPYIDEHSIRSKELREKSCNIWGDLIEKPERQIAEAYAALNHNDVFGVGCFVDKRVVPSPAHMLRSLVSARERRALILYIKQTQWTSGLAHRTDLSHLHRGMLIAALVLGRVYKRMRMWMHYHLAARR